MKLKLWQIDAFASRPFEGNPAAVVPLEEWLPDETLQAIALENNLSETAYFFPEGDGLYALRWFTPTAEVDLCGHATMASAWLVFNELAPALDKVAFSTRSGILNVTRGSDDLLSMSLPSNPVTPLSVRDGFADELGKKLGLPAPSEIHRGNYLLCVWDDAAAIRQFRPGGNFVRLLREINIWGLIVTAPDDGKPYDFVSRFFAPDKGVFEDPVTGSAHTALIPYWAKRLSKKSLRAYQASQRGGDILCTDESARVTLSGKCAPYLRGEIEIS
jgi:PhzF family phenazine biosynthesis protein